MLCQQCQKYLQTLNNLMTDSELCDCVWPVIYWKWLMDPYLLQVHGVNL